MMRVGYSVLNTHIYENKPKAAIALDLLSLPCRLALGGRRVNDIAQTYDDRSSLLTRISCIFLSIFFPPLGIVSAVSLVIKIATRPWIWEKKRVEEQAVRSWSIINQFKTSYEEGNYQKVVDLYNQCPDIGERNDVGQILEHLIQEMVKNNTPLLIIAPFLQKFPDQKCLELIDQILKARIKKEIDSIITSPADFNLFIRKSLQGRGNDLLALGYEKVLTETLTIDPNESIILNALKIEINDCLIRELTKLRLGDTQNPLIKLNISNKEQRLRTSGVFKEKQAGTYGPILESKEKVEEIHELFETIRKINRIQGEWMTLDQNQRLARFKGLFKRLKSFKDPASPMQKNHFQLLKRYCTQLITRIENNSATINVQLPSPETYHNQTMAIIDEFQTSTSNPPFKNLMILLGQLRASDLILTAENMKTALATRLMQQAG